MHGTSELVWRDHNARLTFVDNFPIDSASCGRERTIGLTEESYRNNGAVR
jgi:hypothetical protein